MSQTIAQQNTSKKILLSGVFGPFGVDDRWGRKENIMELFHNQVTKAQGAASFRFHHRSFGLYFMAANLNTDVNVLDFPSRDRFIEEIKKGYDAVGISFIAPNFIKAQEMARLVREHCPGTEIILGGHGAAIEGVEELIKCDHVVKGEGIYWMRRYIGQNLLDPIVHPAIPSTEMQRIFGVSVPGPTSSLLVPGVGCVNACSFCSTSHFFGKKYTAYLGSGKEIFNTCRQIADARGTDSFFVMDENFLKDRDRALELIDEMEKHNRFFTFHVFSSSEAITAFGIDNMVRLGVSFAWIGFESKTDQGAFEKNNGIEPRDLVKQLRDSGISVLGSGILCMEHHTPENIQEDIDFMIDIEADTVQFMLFTPLPVTALYKRHKKKGLLKEDLPFEEWHGQKMLNWNHHAFPGDLAEKTLKGAFKKEFEVNSSTIYRVIETAVRGYENNRKLASKSENYRVRAEQVRDRVIEYATLLPVIKANAVNEIELQRAIALDERVTALVGKPTVKASLMRVGAKVLSGYWNMRLKYKGDVIQPKTIFTEFKVADKEAGKSPIKLFEVSEFTSTVSRDLNKAAFVSAK
ncbi:MAG: radical SAM protein [Deltaproteobacteria bacterium]|nr:radical SAM protein [Deltaproteobacteria bacterium]MBN2671738.1 radical SAM protein [Deltaproteobacteria bacterium]